MTKKTEGRILIIKKGQTMKESVKKIRNKKELISPTLKHLPKEDNPWH